MADVTLDLEENDKIIAELAQQWTEAAEPGSAKVGSVESRGNDDSPMPIVQSKLTSAGYVYVWDRYSGDSSLVNRNMLPVQLRKRYISGPHKGEVAFQRTDPALDKGWTKPKRNRLKCRLHQTDEERGTWDEMGFPLCIKDNLVSPYHQGRHMQSKHKSEWAAILDMRDNREAAEQKEFQRMLMEQAVRTGTPIAAVMPRPARRTKNPNRVAAGKRVAAKLATGAA